MSTEKIALVAGAMRAWVSAFLMVTACVVSASPDIESFTTANGARVLFVRAAALPMIDVRVTFAAGSARDGAHPGVAAFTSTLLDDGAGEWTADQIAERLDATGAQVGSGALRDMAWVSLRSLTDATLLDPAVAIAAAMIGDPRFPPEAVERERGRILTAIKGQDESPAEIGSRVFFETLYAGHPYGTPPAGTPESVAAIRREDIVAHHARWYVAANATVVVVGDVTRAGALALAERLVGGLPRGEAAPALPPPQPLAQSVTRRIEFPSKQSHVLVGEAVSTRDDPDYFPLHVGNYILGGGGFVSRLMQEIREKRGLSYSVHSYFSPMAVPGPFIMGLQTKNEQAGEALKLLGETLDRFLREGPTEKELDAARRGIIGGFALGLDTNAKLVEQIAAIGFYGLPLDWLDRYNARVEAVTRAAVREAFARHLHPDRMATVVVGDGVNGGVAATPPAGAPAHAP